MWVPILLAFAAALATALVLTPAVARLALHRGLVDRPAGRKIHARPIPRVGGIAIFLAFFVGILTLPLSRLVEDQALPASGQILGLLAGGTLVFLLGLRDDVRGMNPWAKLFVQGIAASLACLGGIGIHGVQLPGLGEITLGILSVPVTVFWFLLVINALNLIDGLDGLAAGVSVFSAVTLLILGLLDARLTVSIGLAALGGAALGFLRYNFNPASIFMGDSGSYFLGYMLAGLSILGSLKSEASVTILIPILALGLPLMETFWSAVRRFARGQKVFAADCDHVHHRLLRLGYTHRRAVLLLYSLTGLLGLASLLMVNASDPVAALILLGIALGAGVLIRRLGYVDYLTTEKILGWFRDVTGAVGVERGHRSFLGLQMTLAESSSLEEAWVGLVAAARHLGMDHVRLEVRPGTKESACFEANPASAETDLPVHTGIDPARALWVSFPVGDHLHPAGYVSLGKDLSRGCLEYHILRRVEHLRRTLSDTLMRLLPVEAPHVYPAILKMAARVGTRGGLMPGQALDARHPFPGQARRLGVRGQKHEAVVPVQRKLKVS